MYIGKVRENEEKMIKELIKTMTKLYKNMDMYRFESRRLERCLEEANISLRKADERINELEEELRELKK